MNVSILSDVELNRAIIWLYPPKHRKFNPFKDEVEDCWSGNYEETIDYDYLVDWNLTMPLAVENDLNIDFISKHGTSTDCTHESGIACQDPDPLRAICEVLVMIGMEK